MNKLAMEHPNTPIAIDCYGNQYSGDIMAHYAMMQKGADFCDNCSNFLSQKSWQEMECQECGHHI
ncbi:MAG: hypothetical protein Q8N21_00475 [bacterium]|nr:hypothetical protein [bacterium]